MNKLIGLMAACLFISLPSAVALESNTDPVIAILDTALDTSLPIFKDKVIFEACVTEWDSCPNGMSEMEGLNSSTLNQSWLSKNGFNHGTEMVSTAIMTNPNVKIVFVRIIGANYEGFRKYAGDATVYNALDWVVRNKDRFNIQAVSMSQGHHNLLNSESYCPKSMLTESKIDQLVSYGIPVFFSSGNHGDSSRIDWPACIPKAISMGAISNNKIASYSNYDSKLTDFLAQGSISTIGVSGKSVTVTGTSVSTVIAATQWATIKSINKNLSYDEIYNLISKTAINIRNSKTKSGKLINLKGVLNGQTTNSSRRNY
jgi:hypothetical protein